MAGVQSVILVGETCLLRDMLARAISKIDSLEVVELVNEVEGLPDVLGYFQPDWVIFSHEAGLEIPLSMDAVIAAHPSTRFITMNTNGSHFSVRWLEPRECSLDDATLPELASLFVQGLPGS